MNIYQRINEVRKAVDYLIKDKKVESYMAVTHDAVTAAVRKHFIEHGVVIVPVSVVQSAVKDTETQTSRGTPFIRLEIRYRFEVVNADEPTDKFSIEIEAHALDHGDKAPGKALSYAKKYAVLKLLEIETGEEEEGRQDQHKPKPQAAKSVAQEAWEGMTKARQNQLQDIATAVVDFLNEDNGWEAFNLIETSNLEAEEKIALWSRFDSKQRRVLKDMAAKEKETNG